MAQAGYTPIQLYYSTTASAAPSSGNLANGELAINITDGKLYYKDNGGTVRVLAGTGGTGVVAGSNTQVQFNNNGVFGASANLTFNGTTLTANALTVSNAVTLSGGTANGVAYLNGSKVLTTGSALTFDGTMLGINTATKIDAYDDLTVYSADAPAIRIREGSVAEMTLAVENTDVARFRSNLNMAWSVGGTLGAPGYSGANEAMRLTSTGLGIGTSSPQVQLHLQSSAPVIRLTDTSASTDAEIFCNSAAGSMYLRADHTNVAANSVIGFQIDGSDKMTLDSSGNLGLGVTPSAWGSGYKTMQIGASGNTVYTGNSLFLINNAYYNGTNWLYQTDSGSAVYEINKNTRAHIWYNAPTGTTGGTVTFTQAMTLDASGKLLVGTTSSPSNGSTMGVYSGTSNVGIQLNTGTSGGLFLSNNNGAGARFYNYTGAVGSESYSEVARIDSSGNLGVGTTSPNYKLDVQVAPASNGYNGIDFTDGSNTVLGLFKTGSAYTYGGVGSNQSWIYSNVGDLNITSDGSGIIKFERENGTESARIDSSGNLLVGTTTASDTSGVGFKVLGNGQVPSVVSAATTNAGLQTYEVYSTGAGAYRFYVGGGGTVYATSTTISAISDIRFKENVRDLDAGLAEVMALKPRLYDWKEGKGANIKNARGFIAQEFEQVFPDLIDEWKDPAPEGEEPYKSVRQDLIPVLVKAIQEQQAIIETLTARVAALESK